MSVNEVPIKASSELMKTMMLAFMSNSWTADKGADEAGWGLSQGDRDLGKLSLGRPLPQLHADIIRC